MGTMKEEWQQQQECAPDDSDLMEMQVYQTLSDAAELVAHSDEMSKEFFKMVYAKL